MCELYMLVAFAGGLAVGCWLGLREPPPPPAADEARPRWVPRGYWGGWF
jgi:hypothetical protein